MMASGGIFGNFAEIFVAIIDIFLIIGIGAFLTRKRIVTNEHIRGLSTTTIRIFLPCLIFSSILRNLDPRAMTTWWMLPLLGVMMPLLGLFLGFLAYIPRSGRRKNLIPLAALQNAGYLVLPLGQRLYPQEYEVFSLYCFLYIIGMNVILWSIGKYLITGGSGEFRWRELLTPPLIVNLIAISIVLLGVHEYIPDVAIRGIEFLGGAAVPVATLVLGATLGHIGFRIGDILRCGIPAIVTKLLVMPVATITILYVGGWMESNPLLTRFLVVESAVPPAAGLILQVRTYGGERDLVGGIMLVSYIACIVTIPIALLVLSHIVP